MSRTLPTTASDLQGTVRLATEATTGITDLVEAVHERVARLPGLPPPGRAGRTRGITGWVYRSVRGVTHLVGGSAEALLGLLPARPTQPTHPARLPSPRREALVAAVNGVLGDHLAASGNPLAITMAVRQAGRPLTLERAALAQALPQASGHVLLCIHGLCMNDLQWAQRGHDHGATLAGALGCTTLYLHYNSGQPVATNGRELASRLEALCAAWPVPLQRLTLLGHSMGGLLARSAVFEAQQAGHRWPAALTDMVFLGTPHHGAPLERAGHGVDVLLSALPYAAPFARLGKVRSAGITDLRHGDLRASRQAARGTAAARRATRPPAVPLPAGVHCYALASTLGDSADALQGRVLGDGLVPLDSALGRHPDPARALDIPPAHQWVGVGIGHLALLSDAGVAEQLQAWLSGADGGEGGERALPKGVQGGPESPPVTP
jgi:hypothetical protein